ncbi:WD40 domain containing protein [Pyrrhoderma noxium]|uniref:WD40 domain containing protein n=1 Tax=Pyrrhoderma noxium TaxID=2282107 RepID=A0A286U5S3_9AGAM|nr:WD40 domain containing protein [Pyrrhoderma noxium]
MLVILDALDECGSIHDQEELVVLLKDKLPTMPSNIRLLVTSRPEKGVAPPLPSPSHHSRLCHHVELSHMSENKKEVGYYIRHELEKLRSESRIVVVGNGGWDENIDKFGEAAKGLFIWAATAIEFIKEIRAGRLYRLRRLVNDTRGDGMNLDMLYAMILKNCIDWKDGEMKEKFSSVFSLILFGKTPLSDVDIDEILCYEKGTTSGILKGLRSLVVFMPGQPIWVHHTSLCDYLTSTRCDESWYIDSDVWENNISSRCFRLMKEQLHFNICDLETSFKFNRDVPDFGKRVNKRIHPGLLYACRYWASHLRDVPYSDELLSELDGFAYEQLLYWLEALSLTGSLSECLRPVLESAIRWVKLTSQTLLQIQRPTLEQNNHSQMSSKIASFLEDALHHLSEFIQPISESTPHLYMTFLPLKRSESDVARHYARKMKKPTRIEYTGEGQIMVESSISSILHPSGTGQNLSNPKHWEMLPRKFIGHMDTVNSLSVASTARGSCFASGSSDGTIRLWNVERERGTVGGSVSVITVSPSGEYLVSGSFNGMVSVWRIETGELIKGSLKHGGLVTSVSFSPDGFHFASSSTDGTVVIWSLYGESVMISCKGKTVETICFSPNGEHLASGSNNTIQVWDLKSGEQALDPFEGHSDSINSICYSPDGKKIVSASRDETIGIWDAKNSILLFTIQGRLGWVHSVTYSHDSAYILSGSSDGTIRVWDANDGTLVRKLVDGQKSFVTSICFSPDDRYFVSVSRGKIICVWNIFTRELLFKANISSVVKSVVFLPSSDGKYIKFASASDDGSTRIWCVDVDPKERVWNAPDGDGWLTGNDENLLCWLPSNIRYTLIGGPCIRDLNSRFSTVLTLSKYQGSQWTSCFPSTNVV